MFEGFCRVSISAECRSGSEGSSPLVRAAVGFKANLRLGRRNAKDVLIVRESY